MKFDPFWVTVEPFIGGANYFPDGHGEDRDYPWGLTMAQNDLEMLFQYRTDKEAYAEILPEPFMPADDPIVTVLFAYFHGSDINSGFASFDEAQYSISMIGLNAKFDGEEDHVEGIYNLMMPENNTYCTHMGRDTQGAPKIHVNLPMPYLDHFGNTICDCKQWAYSDGQSAWEKFYSVKFGEMTPGTDEDCRKWEGILNGLPILQVKYIPCGGFNEVTESMMDFKSYTNFSFDRIIRKIWIGEDAEFILNENLDNHLVMEKRCIETLKKLPVKEVVNCVKWYGAIGDSGACVIK